MRSAAQWVVCAATVAVSAATAVPVLAAHGDGYRYGGSSPVLVVLLALAVPVIAVSAMRVHGRASRVGRWLALLAASASAFLGLTALSVLYGWVGARRDLLAEVAVTAHAAAYILPMTLVQCCLLVAASPLGVTGPVVNRLPGLLAAGSLGYTVLTMLTLPVGHPYPWLTPVWHWPVAEALVGIAALPWMLSLLAGPVILWRRLPRAPRPSRKSLFTIAVFSLIPAITILFCVLAGALAFAFGLLTESVGEIGVAAAFGLPLVVCPAALAATSSGSASVRRVITPPVVGTVLTVVVGTAFVIVIVCAGAILGAQAGPGVVVPAVAAATAVVAAAAGPIRRRLVRVMLLRADPVRARTAQLLAHDTGGVQPAEAAQRILRQALEDPQAVLLLHPPGTGWVTAEGAGADPPPQSRGLAITGRGGDPHAHLMHRADPEEAAAAVAEAGSLIERAVLQAAIRDQAARLAVERDRADQAAALERQRLERDLHDGVQGRLLALALDLRMAQRDLGDGPAQLVLADATDALTAAIDELRTLAAGNTPDLLARHGLQAALQDLTRRIPAPIDLQVPQVRLPPAVETIVYLAACEAVTNALKHSGADTITVTVESGPEHALVRVEDDGCGGADLRLGTGLRGLSERVTAAGGRIVIADRQPHGTTVEAVLPCV